MIEVKYDGDSVRINKIVSFTLTNDHGRVLADELCNYYYAQELNKNDMKKLIDALQALYEKMI